MRVYRRRCCKRRYDAAARVYGSACIQREFISIGARLRCRGACVSPPTVSHRWHRARCVSRGARMGRATLPCCSSPGALVCWRRPHPIMLCYVRITYVYIHTSCATSSLSLLQVDDIHYTLYDLHHIQYVHFLNIRHPISLSLSLSIYLSLSLSLSHLSLISLSLSLLQVGSFPVYTM